MSLVIAAKRLCSLVGKKHYPGRSGRPGQLASRPANHLHFTLKEPHFRFRTLVKILEGQHSKSKVRRSNFEGRFGKLSLLESGSTRHELHHRGVESSVGTLTRYLEIKNGLKSKRKNSAITIHRTEGTHKEHVRHNKND